MKRRECGDAQRGRAAAAFSRSGPCMCDEVRGRGGVRMGVRWDHAPGGEVRGKIRRYGGGATFFNLHFTVYHYSLFFFVFCFFFVLDLPANAWSFIVETTK